MLKRIAVAMTTWIDRVVRSVLSGPWSTAPIS